jgi:serine/threonine protein kinase
VHRDRRPENALVDADAGIAKICDFGPAKALRPGEASTAYVASRYCRAPELIMGCAYHSGAINIWAAGCVLGEMLLRGRPFSAGPRRSTSSPQS